MLKPRQAGHVLHGQGARGNGFGIGFGGVPFYWGRKDESMMGRRSCNLVTGYLCRSLIINGRVGFSP